MGIPLRQKLVVLLYIARQRLRGVERYPLVLMLEPLFRCNLACAGCGKIDYPEEILNRRLSVEECLAAIDECGAPVVSIAGGEPLIHQQMPEIVRGLIQRKKFVYLCTNALLLSQRLNDYRPSPYLAFSVHLDGNRERHDASVCRAGVFDRAVEAIRKALERGFRVTVNCTLFQGESAAEVTKFLDDVTALGVEGVTISPGFSYEHAPRRDVFMQRSASKRLFREIFSSRNRRKWRLNHSSLFLDFLAGNQTYRCTPWGNPTRNVLGWQRPCYLLVDEGYAPSFKALMEETDWERYGTGRNPKCANCMAHCGYEATAVNDAVSHPLKALRVALRGPKTDGPLAPELPITYLGDQEGSRYRKSPSTESGSAVDTRSPIS
ncbi:MAG TPA: adenosyl-hopene transferase HpnH [Candidatus Acidoferrales bacterium]|nr:adenosyl-hopene transferase HpnH [Candidatus Acidoferrales bacterium]